MDAATRAAVRARAGNCCEYCQRPQATSPLVPLQIEHIIPRKHDGPDDDDNLALACMECNLHKGSDLTGLDPDTGHLTCLFNPRRDDWDGHFCWDGLRVVGRSAIGRTTVRVLQLNSPARLRVRRATESS
jgi:5-methylcytosine-specific restriction endonuclease McrA